MFYSQAPRRLTLWAAISIRRVICFFSITNRSPSVCVCVGAFACVQCLQHRTNFRLFFVISFLLLFFPSRLLRLLLATKISCATHAKRRTFNGSVAVVVVAAALTACCLLPFQLLAMLC